MDQEDDDLDEELSPEMKTKLAELEGKNLVTS